MAVANAWPGKSIYMTVSLAQGGKGLGAIWGEAKTREYLQKAGFRSIETNRLAHDIQNNWYVVRK